jgi:hypothetical protein
MAHTCDEEPSFVKLREQTTLPSCVAGIHQAQHFQGIQAGLHYQETND